MKVLFYTNVPSPYRVDFFNELGKYCDLTVLFEIENSVERNDAWKEYKFKNFKGIVLNGIRTGVDGSFCPQIIKYVKKDAYDHIVVTQIASLTAIWLVLYMRLLNIPYCYEGDGGFVGATQGIKAAIKRFIIGNAIFCFSTSKEFDKYCLAYGAKKEKIYRYPFSSMKKKDLVMRVPTHSEKQEYKDLLQIKEEFVVLAVGRFIYGKGFDLLLKASCELPMCVGVYIIGGEPTEEYLEMVEKWNLNNVYFLNHLSKEKLAEYYMAANLFVLPTRSDVWGLVINEAMSYGLPVITTDRCIAGLELIENGKNGYIVRNEDWEDIKEKIIKFVCSKELTQKCSERALEIINNYTIEKMAERHIEIFKR